MTTQKTKKETLAEMDAAAKKAKEEFETLCNNLGSLHSDALEDTLEGMRTWWEHWYPTAGHKRLAYILMGKKLNGE